ncbi:hypothetical protein TWF696_002736 [Orbilia brochopaga]|uniref:Uncharacterized protein n=1 Tax=Orbilia brochopaga TaxID=3140254 RepID=A0AAV9U1T9_9PEZI
MASAKGQQVLSLYRAILRELPPIIIRPIATQKAGFPTAPPQPRTRRLPLHEQLRLHVKSVAKTATASSTGENGASQDGESDNAVILRTRQLIRYLEAQRSYAELLERYNAGLYEDNGERIRRAARRVGLEIADSST